MPKPFESKQEEIDYIQRWYKGLPDGSYLKDIFQGVPLIVEKMIKDDWAYSIDSQINDIYAQHEETRKQVAELEQTKKWLESEIARLESSKRAALDFAEDVAHQLEHLWRQVKEFQPA